MNFALYFTSIVRKITIFRVPAMCAVVHPPYRCNYNSACKVGRSVENQWQTDFNIESRFRPPGRGSADRTPRTTCRGRLVKTFICRRAPRGFLYDSASTDKNHRPIYYSVTSFRRSAAGDNSGHFTQTLTLVLSGRPFGLSPAFGCGRGGEMSFVYLPSQTSESVVEFSYFPIVFQ